MIKAVIFDYGNVIAKFDNNIFLEKLSQHTNKKASELNKIIYNSDIPKKYETGLMGSNEFYKKILKICGASISKKDFIKAYTSIFTPLRNNLKLIKKLKKNYKIALLSNTSEWDFEYEIKKNEIFDLFDLVSVSFQVNSMKPDSRIYLDCLDKLKLKPEECVFIDDKEKHIEGAKKMGIKTIHYISNEKLVDSLKKLNIL